MVIRIMPKPHDCEAIGLDYFDRAPTKGVSLVRIKATPAQIFEALEDAEAWPKWVPPITRVTWTSPRPFGPGATRTVDMVGGMFGDEVFFDWVQNERFAFYFSRTTMPADIFAELYEVREVGGGETELKWTMAMTPAKGRKNPKFVDAIIARSNQWMLGRFKKLVERRYAHSGAAASPAQ